jgi:hypothetical protein
VNQPRVPREPDVPPAEEQLAALDDDLSAGAGDPRTRAALAATRAELASLRDPPLPPAVAVRWEAALAAEAERAAIEIDSHQREAEPEDADPEIAAADGQAGPNGRAGRRLTGSSGRTRWGRARPPGRPGTRRRRQPRPALITAAVIAVLVVAALLWPHPAERSLDRVDLAGAARESVGLRDVGGLADPARRAGCLRTVAVPEVAPESPLLGGRHVEFEGRAGVLLVLASGDLGRLHVLVVDPGCGPAGGTLLHAETIGP